MKFSLLSRELIADSIEAVVHGLAYDGLIGFGGCDKTLPGVMMGMIRCNISSIFIYGGSALPGHFQGRTLTALDAYEAVGAVDTGEMDEATLDQIERACLPGIGACAGQFTANTMAMVSEAPGLTMPNVSMVPEDYIGALVRQIDLDAETIELGEPRIGEGHYRHTAFPC
jgi:dihydroxy-acid dehydratase